MMVPVGVMTFHSKVLKVVAIRPMPPLRSNEAVSR